MGDIEVTQLSIYEEKPLDVLTIYRGKEIIQRDFVLDKFCQRDSFNEKSAIIETILKPTLDFILNKYKDKEGFYGVFAKPMKIGMIVEWMPKANETEHCDKYQDAGIVLIVLSIIRLDKLELSQGTKEKKIEQFLTTIIKEDFRIKGNDFYDEEYSVQLYTNGEFIAVFWEGDLYTHYLSDLIELP